MIATTAHISDTNGTYKTPIPDLSVLGYVWSTYPSYSFLEYNNVLVDQFYIDAAIDTLVVKAAFNKDCDANPLKVPLRDIIASFYVYKSGAPHGRDLGMLEKIVYDNVVETDLVCNPFLIFFAPFLSQDPHILTSRCCTSKITNKY